MKKIILICIIGVLISCGHAGDPRTYKRTIKNESSVPIKIYSYNRGNNKLLASLELKNGDSVYKEQKSWPPYNRLNFTIDFFRGNGLIRIKIIYDNKKIAYFENRKGEGFLKERNIIGAKHNYIDNIEKTFTFTKQDYLDAEDCSGDCE